MAEGAVMQRALALDARVPELELCNDHHVAAAWAAARLVARFADHAPTRHTDKVLLAAQTLQHRRELVALNWCLPRLLYPVRVLRTAERMRFKSGDASSQGRPRRRSALQRHTQI